jgi:hypothetical protein
MTLLVLKQPQPFTPLACRVVAAELWEQRGQAVQKLEQACDCEGRPHSSRDARARARLAEAARGALDRAREPKDRRTKDVSIVEKPAGTLTGGPF